MAEQLPSRFWLLRYTTRYDTRYTLITHPTEPDFAILAAWAADELGYVAEWADEHLEMIELDVSTMAEFVRRPSPN